MKYIMIIFATALLVLPLTGSTTNNSTLAQSESEIVTEPIPEDEPIIDSNDGTYRFEQWKKEREVQVEKGRPVGEHQRHVIA